MDTVIQFFSSETSLGREGVIPLCALIFKKNHELQKHVLSASFSYCVIPENIHISSMEGIFSKRPPYLTPLEIPTGNSNPFCRWSMNILWNCTFCLTNSWITCHIISSYFYPYHRPHIHHLPLLTLHASWYWQLSRQSLTWRLNNCFR